MNRGVKQSLRTRSSRVAREAGWAVHGIVLERALSPCAVPSVCPVTPCERTRATIIGEAKMMTGGPQYYWYFSE